jgi:beta-galactosidase
VEITVEDAGELTRKMKAEATVGKAMHEEPFGSAVILFSSDGEYPVRITFSDAQKEKGIWLNAFTLSPWYE